jgi:hypothetical protein
VNQATQSIISAAERLAEKEGKTTEQVMQDAMNDPTSVFPLLFTAENLKELVPEDVQNVCLHDQCSSFHVSLIDCLTS